MTILFSSSNPLYPTLTFLVTNLRNILFEPNFKIRQIKDVDFKYSKRIFSPKMYPKLSILDPNCKNFYSCTKVCTKIGGTDFKYYSIFSKLLFKTSKLEIFVRNISIFSLAKVFTIRQIPVRWFQVWPYLF